MPAAPSPTPLPPDPLTLALQHRFIPLFGLLPDIVDLLDSGAYTVASLGVMAADIDLNVINIKLVGLAQQGLEYTPYLGVSVGRRLRAMIPGPLPHYQAADRAATAILAL